MGLVGEPFTDRERAVVQGVLAGKSQKAIAADLGLRPKTIAVYCHRAARKLPGDAPPMRRILLWHAGRRQWPARP